MDAAHAASAVALCSGPTRRLARSGLVVGARVLATHLQRLLAPPTNSPVHMSEPDLQLAVVLTEAPPVPPVAAGEPR